MEFIKCKLVPDAFAPERAYRTDAGWDLKTPYDVVVGPCMTSQGAGKSIIDTGVHIAIPEGYCGLIVAKSGLNVKSHLTATGLIDSGYSGSIRVKLYNYGSHEYEFKRGDKVAQIIFIPICTAALVLVDDIEKGERGDNGFGSSGK